MGSSVATMLTLRRYLGRLIPAQERRETPWPGFTIAPSDQPYGLGRRTDVPPGGGAPLRTSDPWRRRPPSRRGGNDPRQSSQLAYGMSARDRRHATEEARGRGPSHHPVVTVVDRDVGRHRRCALDFGVLHGHLAWLTLTLFAFGIPEFIGTLKQDDRYPPLTHVIVRYVDREIAFPLLFGFAGAIGAYWFGVPRPQNMGLLVGLIGWLSAHFDRRYEQSDAKK